MRRDITEQPTVALLIDWENFKFSTTNHLKSPPDIITLKKAARKYGKIAVARAYANWSDLRHEGEMERLFLQDIEPVFVQTREIKSEEEQTTVKGSVDIRIACDCMELLFKNPEISSFVLVSGDGGFSHIINKIKAYGKRAIPVGVRAATSAQLGIVSDELLLYDDLIRGITRTTDDRVKNAMQMFKEAVEEIRSVGAKNTLDFIKTSMRKKEPNFEEEKINIPSFRHLAYLAESNNLVKVDSTSEPAAAYNFSETKTESGVDLYTGTEWKAFIQEIRQNIPYKISDLKDIIRKIEPNKSPNNFINNVLGSGIFWVQKNQFIGEDGEVVTTREYVLNLHHPKVQVYKTAR